MSSESFAALRKSHGETFANLAQEHFRHDLKEQDREALESAAKSFSTHAAVGSAIGLGLGVLFAFRLRSARTKAFQAFKAAEKPTHVRFAGGREEPLPDMTSVLKPSTLGDLAAYTFGGAGGVFLGGELGLLTGSMSASSTISKDPDSRKRIETAFRRFRADVLRKEAEQLELGQTPIREF